MKDTIFITGASGFIATHTITQLLKQGYRIRGSLRNLNRADQIRALVGADEDSLVFVRADLSQDEGWDELVQGCKRGLHMASPIAAATPKDPEKEMIGPAVEGTERVIQACLREGVERLVMTSSMAAVVYGHEKGRENFDCSSWTNLKGPGLNPYIVSKTKAEQRAWELVEGTSLKLTTILPSAVLGPVLEKDIGTSALIVKKLVSGEVPGIPPLGWPVVDVRDVADLHARALQDDEAIGKRYLCGNEFMWMADVAALLGQEMPELKKKLPKLQLPAFLVKLLAVFDKEIAGVTNELNFRKELDTEPARSELGWTPRPAAEAVLSCAKSLQQFA